MTFDLFARFCLALDADIGNKFESNPCRLQSFHVGNDFEVASDSGVFKLCRIVLIAVSGAPLAQYFFDRCAGFRSICDGMQAESYVAGMIRCGAVMSPC